MAILGTYVDRILSTRAGDNLTGVTLTTLAHSLPATNPDAVIPVMRSIQNNADMAAGAWLFALRGNASLNTIGFSVPTTRSAPTIEFEMVSILFHSTIR